MENEDQIRMLEFDINFIENQIYLCKYFIDNGCWEGYSDNLISQKQRLKELRKERQELEKQIFELNNTNPF